VRVLLINPPRSSENAILAHAPAQALPFIHKKLIGPPLGLLTLAGAIKADHDVSLLEMKGEYDLDPKAPAPDLLVKRYLAAHKPQVVGVTFIASEFPSGLEILQTVKAWDPTIVTVVGGLHASLCPEDFDDPAVDVLCCGPSACSFSQVLRALERGDGLDRVGGIMVRQDGRLLATGVKPRPIEPAGRDFVLPDRTLLKRWLATYVVGKAPGPSTYVFTSLGCPYKCSFCSIWPQYDGQYLQRDVESLIEELKGLDEYEVVRFADANTLVNLDFANQLFDRILAEGIKKTFVMDIRADTAARHPELIAKLARGGLKVVIVGFESFRQEELKKYGKDLEADLIAKSIRVFHDHGIMLRGNYIVPPDYDDGDFKSLAQFAGQNPVAFAGYTILTPMPGTSYHREVRHRIVDHDLAKYNMFNCVLHTTLERDEFHRRVGELWAIRKGDQTI